MISAIDLDDIEAARRLLRQARRLDGYTNDGNDDFTEEWTASEEGISSYFVVFLNLLAIVLILSKFLHERPKLSSLLPEAGMTVIVGIAASGIIYLIAPSLIRHFEDDETNKTEDQVAGITKGLLSFSPTYFFTMLLPPIIFNGGYHVNRELFFRHIRPILLYSLLGTLINIFAMAGMLQLVVSANLTGGFKPRFSELLTFGSLIASTDPVSILSIFQKKQVDPQLFYLVFGESVLNDGVCLVLFEAFSKIVGDEESDQSAGDAALTIVLTFLISFIGSLSLGVLSGIAVAWLLKTIEMRHTRLLELALYVLVMYLPFFISDAIGMSGIVTILFTGISARRYAEPNLSPDTRAEADVLFRLTAHLAETVIFLELGLSLFGLGVSSFADFYAQFVGWSLLACLIGRACSIYPVTLLNNSFVDCKTVSHHDEIDPEGSLAYVVYEPKQSDLKVKPKTAHMLWFAGLRGAVAYACSKKFPDYYGSQREFVIITMFIVLVTIFLLGSTSECVLNILKIETFVDEEEYMADKNEALKGGALRRFNEKYICPCVIRGFNEEPTVPERQQELMQSVRDSFRQLMEGHAVEMTADDHDRIVTEMGMRYSNPRKRHTSIFDFGN